MKDYTDSMYRVIGSITKRDADSVSFLIPSFDMDGIDNETFEYTVPASVLPFPISELNSHLLVKVNLHAKTPMEVKFADFEIAPEPRDDLL